MPRATTSFASKTAAFYSSAKDLRIGTNTLECAACLNEFQDHETLRFIPRCNHVFHSHCIDFWLSYHSTCPVCHAKLGDTAPSVALQISDPGFEDVEPQLRPDSNEAHGYSIANDDTNMWRWNLPV
ncbi:hypothetical protein L6164_016040 [Bauhinia variegata]|uniref:Uncharacterized protein n=1 Tax=Bauhinia variegata TaxID=167791 RepID=A0ACB9NPS2_BAUVA|nr:hypothetical protein L6164_016040 [Bauhinia variegata]